MSWGRHQPKFVVVDCGAEVLVDGVDEVLPIKKWHVLREAGVPAICRACQVESCIGDLVIIGVWLPSE
jgi:hypothetical protein